VVLKTSIMDPIGASDTWHWEPRKRLRHDRWQAHAVGAGRWPSRRWMFINAHDMARFIPVLRNGKWNGKQLISEKWIAMARTPGQARTPEARPRIHELFLNNRGRRCGR
jgi:CubicO group peptidase (beta-lactamase class C family)